MFKYIYIFKSKIQEGQEHVPGLDPTAPIRADSPSRSKSRVLSITPPHHLPSVYIYSRNQTSIDSGFEACQNRQCDNSTPEGITELPECRTLRCVTEFPHLGEGSELFALVLVRGNFHQAPRTGPLYAERKYKNLVFVLAG